MVLGSRLGNSHVVADLLDGDGVSPCVIHRALAEIETSFVKGANATIQYSLGVLAVGSNDDDTAEAEVVSAFAALSGRQRRGYRR